MAKVHKIFEGELLFDFSLTFLYKLFSKKSFCGRNIPKIVRPDLAALSVNELTCVFTKGFIKILSNSASSLVLLRFK